MPMMQVTDEQFDRLEAALKHREAVDVEDIPDEKAALYVMFRGFDRLRKLGWREVTYCPRDGKTVELIEPGSTGIHRGYRDEKGAFWVVDDDVWPSRPCLWRPVQAPDPAPHSSNTVK